jgi:hypothetical protein
MMLEVSRSQLAQLLQSGFRVDSAVRRCPGGRSGVSRERETTLAMVLEVSRSQLTQLLPSDSKLAPELGYFA